MMEAVRHILHSDPRWSLYALGDLAPPRREHCRWLLNPRQTALILLYAEFGAPILFAIGTADELEEIVAGPALPDHVYLHIQPPLLPLLQRRYPHVKTKLMHRMAFGGAELPMSPGTVPLTGGDLAKLQALYGDGVEANESPDFFFPQMLEDGLFHGLYKEGELAAAAGTHMVYEEESIGAVGNVYTRRKWRRHGLGRLVTAAVTRSLLARGIRTIGLNVSAGNPARRVYESLGYVHHCDFVEGPAAS